MKKELDNYEKRNIRLIVASSPLAIVGCHSSKTAGKKNDDFFTSGSREADQRASQRMAKDEQLAGTGEGAGEKGVKKAKVEGQGGTAPGTNSGAKVEGKLSLYDRLGG